MTNFNPKNQEKSNDEWAELALQKSANSNTQFQVIGGLFGAVFVAGATSPITGLILGAWVIYSAWNKSGESARNKDHIISTRCIANTLEGDDFIHYKEQFGEEAVKAQLDYADKLNLGMSNDALDFLDDLEDAERFKFQPKLFPATNSQQALENKLDVADNPLTHNPLHLAEGETLPDTETLWVNDVLQMPFKIITGDQGSGKSTLERYMISRLKNEGYHVIIINPETNPKVWKGVTVIADPNKITEFFAYFPAEVKKRQMEARRLEMDEDDYLDFLSKSNRTGMDGRVAIFFQESNTYQVQGVDADAIADAFKQCLTNIRKWGFTATLTAHSNNQTSISSKLKGYSSQINQMPLIECFATTDPETGRTVSSGKGKLSIKGKNDPNPKDVKLINFPSTKDFRTEAEKNGNSNQETKIIDKTSASKKESPTIIQESDDTAQIIDRLFKSLKNADTDNLSEAIKELNPEMKANEIKKMVGIIRDKAVLRGDSEILKKFKIITKDA